MNTPEKFTAQAILAIVAVALFACLLAMLLLRVVPDQNRELVSTAMGFLLGNMVGPAYQWFFGSSAGSEKKTDALIAGGTGSGSQENPPPKG